MEMEMEMEMEMQMEMEMVAACLCKRAKRVIYLPSLESTIVSFHYYIFSATYYIRCEYDCMYMYMDVCVCVYVCIYCV